MWTSNFFTPLPDGAIPVAISRSVPSGWRGRRVLTVAPTWPLLQLNRLDYIDTYQAILARLDPVKVAAEFGMDTVLLCWEPPHVFCHRRMVAEWLEADLGIEIPEVGFPRAEYPSYRDLPASKRKSKGRGGG
jgi:hypothetical protein